MFASGPSDNHYSIFHKWHGTNMSWYPSDDSWEDLNSLVITNVETVLSQSEIYMFCLDINAELFYSTYSKNMSAGSWKRIGEPSETWALYTPAVVSWTEGRFDVFVVDPETSEVMWRYYDGTINLRVWAGSPRADPRAYQPSRGRLTCLLAVEIKVFGGCPTQTVPGRTGPMSAVMSP
jgi:hypothetical protein